MRENDLVTPEQFVHPRQRYLMKRLQGGLLPEGADQLLRDAIAEYQAAFGDPIKPDLSRTVQSKLSITIPEDSSGVILAGKPHLLTIRFGESSADGFLAEQLTHVMVAVNLRNMPGTDIYPDWLRCPAVDVNGRSEPIPFLLAVPDNLKGYNSIVEVSVINGGSLVFHSTMDLHLA